MSEDDQKSESDRSFKKRATDSDVGVSAVPVRVDDHPAIAKSREPVFAVCLNWRGKSSPLEQLGIVVEHDPIKDSVRASRNEIEHALASRPISYFPGTCLSWLVETSVVVPNFGCPVPVTSVIATNVNFINKLHVQLPWRTEMILISYLERFTDATSDELLRFTLKYCLPVVVSWDQNHGRKWAQGYRDEHGLCSDYHEVLAHRPIPSTLTPSRICQDWLNRVTYLFHHPEARRFVFYGGFISRLAVEIMGQDFLTQAVQEPSHRYLAHGQRTIIQEENQWESRDSEMRSTSAEDEVLKDIYGYTTESRSLWPPLHVFLESERWTGLWSNHNETWFKKMMEMIRNGLLQPQAWEEKRGKAPGISLHSQGPSERKVLALRRKGQSLLKDWRGEGILNVKGTPLEASGLLSMGMLRLLAVRP
jgi:hypothetical protein